MKKISIKNLELYGYFGVLDSEKENGQKFVLNIDMVAKHNSCVYTDNLTDTVDYGAVAQLCYEFFNKHHFNLIEAAGYRLAEAILLKFDELESIKLQIAKPNAPINLTFEDVSVTNELKWNKVAVSLGSNMGDKSAYLDMAIKAFEDNPAIKNIVESQRIITEPYGNVQQDNFLNSCVTFETYLEPDVLLYFTSQIENKAKRVRTEKWGPRTLDVDILLYSDRIIATKDLVIPHIDMLNREFVLKPLAELAPFMLHPVARDYIGNIYNDFKNRQ